MRGSRKVVFADACRADRFAPLIPDGVPEHRTGVSTLYKSAPSPVDPHQPKTAFLVQLCLSQGAGVSIILPTLPRKPRYCFP